MLTRFAPSPTGFLHLGHARSAFEVWHAADRLNGAVCLRLEDIDQTRCRTVFDGAIFEDLRWLGLAWQGAVRRQSDHFGAYQTALDTLRGRGLLYRCFRTRSQLAGIGATAFSAGPLPEADERARLEAGDPFAWRLSLSAARAALGARYSALRYQEDHDEGLRSHAAEPDRLGDVVLARKDTPASYHLACCHDDALQAITHIVRGEDLREATHSHVLLQALMDWPVPVYRFHPLLMTPSGRKLAKRDGDKALRAWRAEGVTPEAIRAMSGAP